MAYREVAMWKILEVLRRVVEQAAIVGAVFRPQPLSEALVTSLTIYLGRRFTSS